MALLKIATAATAALIAVAARAEIHGGENGPPPPPFDCLADCSAKQSAPNNNHFEEVRQALWERQKQAQMQAQMQPTPKGK